MADMKGFFHGKTCRVSINNIDLPFDEADVVLRQEKGKTTNFKTEGFHTFISGIFGATCNLAGPMYLSYYAFSVGDFITVDISYFDGSAHLILTCLVDEVNIPTKDEEVQRITVNTTVNGKYQIKVPGSPGAATLVTPLTIG